MPIKEIKEIVLSIFKVNPFRVISKRKIIIGIILLLGIAQLLYQSLISQQILKLKAMKLLFVSEKRLVDCKEKLTKDPSALLREIENTKIRFNELKSRFVAEKDLPGFFDDLRRLVSQTGSRLVSLDVKPLVPIKDLDLAEETKAAYYARLPLTIAVSGDYVSTLLLLNKIEQVLHLIEIKSIKLSSGGESGSVVSMGLGLDLYVLKD